MNNRSISFQRRAASFAMGLAAGGLAIAGSILMGLGLQPDWLAKAMLAGAGVVLILGSLF